MTDYYSIPALSASGINAFYKSPLHFWRESPFNPDRIVRAETPAMRFGKLCHALALEPETVKPEEHKADHLVDSRMDRELAELEQGRTIMKVAKK